MKMLIKSLRPLRFLECYHTITNPSDSVLLHDNMKFYSRPEQKIEVVLRILVRKQSFSGNNSNSACYRVYVQAKRYFVSLHPNGIPNSLPAWIIVDCCLASRVLYSGGHLGISRSIFPISGTSRLLSDLEQLGIIISAVRVTKMSFGLKPSIDSTYQLNTHHRTNIRAEPCKLSLRLLVTYTSCIRSLLDYHDPRGCEVFSHLLRTSRE